VFTITIKWAQLTTGQGFVSLCDKIAAGLNVALWLGLGSWRSILIHLKGMRVFWCQCGRCCGAKKSQERMAKFWRN
jgi:hypothetical protein